MKKLIVPVVKFAATCLIAHGAWAAQFTPTTDGNLNLDDASNWNNTTHTSYAVIMQQSAALTLSADSATLPNSGSLIYRTNVHTNDFGTNDFGVGKTLTVAGLTVEQGATLVHKSGTIASTAAATFNNGAAVFTGTGSVLDGTSATLSNGGSLAIEDGAAWNFTRSVTINSGTKVVADGATLSMNTPSSGTSYYITVNEGGTFAVKDSTVNLANGKAHIAINNATATFDGAAISMGESNASSIGGDGGTVLFTGGTSEINRRFSMTGNGFCFAVSNTTVNFNPTNTGDLFIMGAGNSNESTETGSERVLRFSGASPHLIVGGTAGLFLRGKKITLQFDLPKGEFTTLPIIEIPNVSASFRGDEYTLGTSQIVVNIDDHTAPGTYTLLKGKNASTFLTGENKWVTNSDRAVISAATVGGVDAVQVTVKKSGFIMAVY